MRSKIVVFIFVFIISFALLGTVNGSSPSDDGMECKSIIAKGEATPGDYTLHMKIRDPSRAGDQVLFICEPGYQYTYHHPTTGEDMDFTVENRVIGVATSGDTPPNIMKAGMALTDKGISYGDNDIDLLYTNPSEYAWDDFDWLRYGYQTAQSEDESVAFLVDEAVHELHATGKGEALYVVGPEHAYVIESNAVDAVVDEIEDVYVRTNYPVRLWETATKERYQYGPHFDSKFDGWVRTGETVKLGPACTYGILVEDIGDDTISVRAIHRETESIELNKGEVKSLCGFRVGLEEIENRGFMRARITLCYHYLEWQERMDRIVMSEYGNITLQNMMCWSRLHEEDLGGLRPMCEGSVDNAESVAIYSIPDQNPEIMSSFWYTCHPCASIYAPVHICTEKLHEPYTTEEAYDLFKDSFDMRGHSPSTCILSDVESVFIEENEFMEELAFGLIRDGDMEKVPGLLTQSDLMMQEHALLMVELLIEAGEEGNTLLHNMWRYDYEDSFAGFGELLSTLTSGEGSDPEMTAVLMNICERAARYKIEQVRSLDGDSGGIGKASEIYGDAMEDREEGRYSNALEGFRTAFLISQRMLEGEDYSDLTRGAETRGYTITYSLIAVVLILVIALVLLLRKYDLSIR